MTSNTLIQTSHNGYAPGLAGVVAAETRLSSIDGTRGELIIAGYPLEEIASNASFEAMAYLLWHGTLPDARALQAFKDEIAAVRVLPPTTIQILEAAACQQVPAIDALRMAAGTFDIDQPAASLTEATRTRLLVARFPTAVAAYARLSQGHVPIAPDPALDHAANFLYMLTGQVPSVARARSLETYLNTVCEHGLNASTFAARVIIATESDMVSAIVGALGALKGPRHGGAPGPALDMVFEIQQAGGAMSAEDAAEAIMRAKLANGERLMGFGHRVYKVRDPRAAVLATAAETMYRADGDMALYDLAKHVETLAIRLLEAHKPGRNLQTNVEFYTALLLHGLGLGTDLFTPTFAIGRVVGWIAHCFEQQAEGRIIRPLARYVGERARVWVPLDKR